MTEHEKFVARFKEKQGKGLQDVKFCIDASASIQSADDLFAAANRIDDAIESEQCLRHTSFEESFERKKIADIMS